MASFDHRDFIDSMDKMKIKYDNREYTLAEILEMPMEDIEKIYLSIANKVKEIGEKQTPDELDTFKAGVAQLEGVQIYNFVRAINSELKDLADKMLALAIIMDSKRNGLTFNGDYLVLEILNRLCSIGIPEDPEMKGPYGLKAIRVEVEDSVSYPKKNYVMTTYANADADKYKYIQFQNKIREIINDCVKLDDEIRISL